MKIYSDIHQVQAGDSLYNIGKQYGFDNPGPIVYFTTSRARKPVNAKLYQNRSALTIYPGQVLAIPWTTAQLKLATSRLSNMIRSLDKQFQKDEAEIKQGTHDYKKLQTSLDIGSTVITCLIGIGMAAKAGSAVMAGKESLNHAKVAKEFFRGRGMNAHSIASLSYTPKAENRAWKGAQRFGLGLLSPSYWSDVSMAVNEWDSGYLVDGAGHGQKKIIEKLRVARDASVKELRREITNMNLQASMPFYTRRV
ncbi:MAG: LysM domain-containing protein [Bacteroidota bacterium]